MFPNIIFVYIEKISNQRPFHPEELSLLPKQQIMNYGALDRSQSYSAKWDRDYNNFPLDFGSFIE